MSVNSTNPSQLFGGTWEQISGRFLYCTTTSKITGGDTVTGSHILMVSEMPSHSHTMSKGGKDSNGKFYENNQGYSSNGNSGSGKYWWSYTTYTGGGQGHTHPQNLPPYFTVYCWYRVS